MRNWRLEIAAKRAEFEKQFNIAADLAQQLNKLCAEQAASKVKAVGAQTQVQRAPTARK